MNHVLLKQKITEISKHQDAIQLLLKEIVSINRNKNLTREDRLVLVAEERKKQEENEIMKQLVPNARRFSNE
jgi:hypothetical protein